MTGWERLGLGGLSQGYLSGRLSPSAVLDDAPAGIAVIDDDRSAGTSRQRTQAERGPATRGTRASSVADRAAGPRLPWAPASSRVSVPSPARKPTLANRKSRIMRRRGATHNTRANAHVTRLRVLADSEPSPFE